MSHPLKTALCLLMGGCAAARPVVVPPPAPTPGPQTLAPTPIEPHTCPASFVEAQGVVGWGGGFSTGSPLPDRHEADAMAADALRMSIPHCEYEQGVCEAAARQVGCDSWVMEFRCVEASALPDGAGVLGIHDVYWDCPRRM
jgi:hypothetical protein